MKWAKTSKHLNSIRELLEDPDFIVDKNADNDEYLAAVKKYYQEIEDKPTIDSLEKRGFRPWLTVKNVPKGYKRARARYEAFVGGYLYYFEKYVSKIPKDNRTLYFDWGKINKKSELTIFLSPLYAKSTHSSKDSVLKSDKNGLSVFKADFAEKENGHGKGNQIRKNRTANRAALAIAPPPDTDGPVDPPPPPPPPPPPRD